MTLDEMKDWVKKTNPSDVFDVKRDSAEWYSNLPKELRDGGVSLVLLELAIIVFEWNKDRKEPGFVS